MKDFIVDGRTYVLDENVRNQVKPGWQEMLNPAKTRKLKPNPLDFISSVVTAEKLLETVGESLIFKKILEVGCNEGARCFLMAKYQDTYVRGIDVDLYTVDQSPDLNAWNPKDVDFVHSKFDEMREDMAAHFPNVITNKVEFETCDIAEYVPKDGLYDVIMSWDTIEHIIDLPKAFKAMAGCLYRGEIAYHEYNPFLSVNGGHSLCTLDFLYGHCRLKEEDFKRYIKEIRPEEEKIDINFYNKCLNRASMLDVRKYAEDAGFEVLLMKGVSSFGLDNTSWRTRLEKDTLPDVVKIYPSATVDDLIYNSVHLILKKK